MKKIIVLFLILSASLYTLQAQEYKSLVFVADSLDQDAYFQDDLLAGMDTMMQLWYVRKGVENGKSVLCKKDSCSTVWSDSLIVDRLKKIETVIPLSYNDRVKRWIELYVEKRKLSSSVLLGLARYYYPWMKEIFDKYGVPEELVYLTIIESGLNPVAVSKAGATGIFQFMYTTGKMYGLEVNTFIDDRRDPYKATDAAARHLKDLYAMFQDWGLAIAAYNCGPGNVRKAIYRTGPAARYDFWTISKNLPKETQNYFPAYIGVLYLMNYHTQHGILPTEITLPLSVDTVMINKELHFEQLSRVLDVDIEEIQLLNPQYKRNVIPAYANAYPLRLKTADVLTYMALADTIHALDHTTYFTPMKVYENMLSGTKDPQLKTKNIYHTVKSGESLSKISAKYHLSVYELKKMNNLTSNNIRPKQRLLVGYQVIETPKPEPAPSLVSTSDSTANVALVEKEVPVEPEIEYYIVKKGDTLSTIASRYNTNAKRIAQYNGIYNMNALSIGQKLKIPK